MTVDFSQLQFSEEPLEGIEEDQQNWKPANEFPPPPEPGKYTGFIKQIREIREKLTKDKGPRVVVCFDVQLMENDRVIAFNWASNIEYMTADRGRTSTLLDLVKSAGIQGIVRTNKDFVSFLQKMEGNNQITFKISVDWKGSCRTCYSQKLIGLTGEENGDLAAEHATKEQKDEANKFALKFKNYRAFPQADNDPNKRKSVVLCSDCGDEIRAQANISRYLLDSDK